MDLFVKLYDLPSLDEAMKRVEEQGIVIRKPIGAEKATVIEWIKNNIKDTGERWAGESEVAFFNSPRTMYIALDSNCKDRTKRLVGFACYDATAKGFFGPTGVDETYRGRGIGKALLLSCLYGMRDDGYGYAAIGSVGPNGRKFYGACLPGCKPIEDSDPSIYGLMV